MTSTCHFYKYQGTGNDFVMIDNRTLHFPKENTSWIAHLCDRRKGIGADGLILLEKDTSTDFRMVYYNSDGRESTMCGNGGRCIVRFAQHLGLIKDDCTFIAIDGLHRATLTTAAIALEMSDVPEINIEKDGVFLNTGSPHHVVFVTDAKTTDVFSEGKTIRNSEKYAPSGTNVNFVSPLADGHFLVRTYERGVEDETLSCGTGVTAATLALHATGQLRQNQAHIEVLGGHLSVSFTPFEQGYQDIVLTGPAQFVFQGTITIP